MNKYLDALGVIVPRPGSGRFYDGMGLYSREGGMDE